MNLEHKRVLYINLDTHEHEFKIHADLWQYVGGVGLAYKLLSDNAETLPIIICTGPLSGYFPYVSKCCLLYTSQNRAIELYGGGTIAGLMNMLKIDAIVLHGQPRKHTHITVYKQNLIFETKTTSTFNDTTTSLSITSNHVTSNQYFSFGEITTYPLNISKGVSISIGATLSSDLSNFYDYEKLYTDILDEYTKLTVEPRNNPSCLGCPLGCDKSHEGEDDVNIAILPRCLISCGYAEDIYKSIPRVYSALSSLGHQYKHSHLEKLPELVGEIKTTVGKMLSKKDKRE